MATRIIDAQVRDIRFPTSKSMDGSDAMNGNSDYSATYVTLVTDARNGIDGHGPTFTIGRGNELCADAVKSLAKLFVIGPEWRA